MSARERLALYGCDEHLPSRLSLRAGPVSFELVGGRFGPLRVNGHEVWHGLAFLFRDAAWGTPEPVFEQVQHHTEGQGFRLQLRGHIPCAPSDVAGGPAEDARILLDVQVQGDADGRLHFLAHATPTHALLSNRCGWVLMHPMSVAGCALEVLHVDGRTSHATFPSEVAAWPPFMGVRGLRHEYLSGHWAEAHLPDEDYELEDQRNNADASFKTYGRSNLMPRPFVLPPYQPWVRELHLRLLGPLPDASSSQSVAWTWQWPEVKPCAMQLGLALTADMSHAPSPWLLAVLQDWRPAFLHLTLWTGTAMDAVDWPGVNALLQAAGASLRLDLCVPKGLGHGGPDDAICLALAQRLALIGLVPGSVAALPCGAQAARFLRQVFPASAIGGGTPHFFAQLNRLEGSGGEDFMAFTVCPIVHGADDETVMNGLQSLPSMLDTARRRHPGRDWHIGPSTLPARASPLGPQPHSDGQRRLPLAACDPRTRGLFGAAWLLGHLVGALQARVQALTLPPVMGDAGLWWSVGAVRHMTPSAAMLQVCLRWHSLQALVLHSAEATQPALSGGPVVAMAGQTAQGRHILLANLSAHPQPLHWTHGGQWAVLDAQSWARYQDTPESQPWRESGLCTADAVLAPYGLARIDLPLSPGD